MPWAGIGALGFGLVIGLAAAAGGAEADFPGCPEGTEEMRLDTVGTEIRWCERPGAEGRGVRHGPSQKTRQGRLLEAGPYRDGVRHGGWILSVTEGIVQEGEYRDDRRAGVWIIRREDGEEIRRHDYGDSEGPTPAAEDMGPPKPEVQTRLLRVGNQRTGELELVLEPDGPVLLLGPGDDVELGLDAAAAGELLIESGDDSLTLRAPRSGVLRVGGAAPEQPLP